MGPPGAHIDQTRRLLWMYLALVAIHLISGAAAQQPIVLADELGYLGNARYIAGTSHLPDMQGTQLYHFGYSLFLVPAFWVFSDPVSTYKTAIAINALLASSLIVPLYVLLSALLSLPPRTARWVAFACCLYPPLIFHSSIAWSENLYIPLYASVVALFGRFLASRAHRDAVLFGAAAGFLYAVHPRGAPVVVGVVAVLALLALLRSAPIPALGSAAASTGAVVLATRFALQRLKTVGWGSDGEILIGKIAGRVAPDGDLPAIVERIAGQLLYLAQSTDGLAILGLLVTIGLVARRLLAGSLREALAEPAAGSMVLMLVTSGGVFLASCLAKLYSLHGPDGVRADNLIYGRYNEAFAVVLVAVAASWLVGPGDRAPSPRWRLAAVTTVLAVIVLLTTVTSNEVDDALARHAMATPGAVEVDRVSPADIQASSVPGIFPLIVGFGGLDLAAISAVVLVAFVLVVAVSRVSPRLALGLVAALFVCVGAANHRLHLEPATARAAPRLAFASHLESIGPMERIAYDSAHLDRSFYGGLQYLTPDTVYERFDSRNDEVPVGEAVISSASWHQAERFGATFYVSAGRVDNALWLLPGRPGSEMPRTTVEGNLLGAEPVVGVRATGFGPYERTARRSGRWTDGSATLVVNTDPNRPPLMLGFDVAGTGRDTAAVELRVNGVTIWQGTLPRAGAAATFRLDTVPMNDRLTIEILSDTVLVARPHDGRGRQRSLGVFIGGVRLAGRESLAAAAVGGLPLGAELVLGYPESGFYGAERHGHAPARWTDGAASLRIPLHPDHLPDRLEVATVAPGRDSAGLRVRANGIVLWDGAIPSRPWSRSFALTDVPLGDELHIELESDTFRPSETIDGSTDRRRLGVKVCSIRLSAATEPDRTQ